MIRPLLRDVVPSVIRVVEQQLILVDAIDKHPVCGLWVVGCVDAGVVADGQRPVIVGSNEHSPDTTHTNRPGLAGSAQAT